MNASSESGECASLISRASVDVFEVACPVMGLVVPFAPRSLRLSVHSPSASFQTQPAAGKKPALPRPFACVEASLPRSSGTPAEREREDVSNAETCAARADSCNAKPSISARSRQTFWPSQYPSFSPIVLPIVRQAQALFRVFLRRRSEVAAARLQIIVGFNELGITRSACSV